MSNITIPNLPAAISVNGSEQIAAVQGGVSVRITAFQFASWVTGNFTGTVTSVSASGGATGMTFAGSPITSNGTFTLGGTLNIANGGTGQQTAIAAFNALSPITSNGDFIIGNGANSATRLPIGANGYILTSNGATAVWASPGSTTVTITAGSTLTSGFSAGQILSSNGANVSAISQVPIANGGTGQNNATSAFNALSPVTTRGDLIVGNGTNSSVRLPIGTSGYVLSSNGIDVVWAAPSSGTVTNVSFTGGLISVNNPSTTPSLTVAGTSGGIPYFNSASTWASSALLNQYGVMYGGGAGAPPNATAVGTTGQVLTGNTGAAPTWQTLLTIMTALANSLPTTLPGTSGVLWNNGGVISIS